MKKNVVLTTLAALLLLTGCGNSAESHAGTSGADTPTINEPVSETVTESSDNAVSSSSVSETSQNDTSSSETTTTEPIAEVNEMKITVNGTEFSAKFSDTKAAEEFKAMLPLALDMSELNGNEKYNYLDIKLSVESENVGHINSGDIMLYGSNCIVLFYESFSTPYSYTRIGRIDDPSGLKNAVGKGGVTVEFKG